MTTAKSPSIQERSRLYVIMLQDLMKRGVCRRAVEMLLEGVAACLIFIKSPSNGNALPRSKCRLEQLGY
jgi:hypothetical protein